MVRDPGRPRAANESVRAVTLPAIATPEDSAQQALEQALARIRLNLDILERHRRSLPPRVGSDLAWFGRRVAKIGRESRGEERPAA